MKRFMTILIAASLAASAFLMPVAAQDVVEISIRCKSSPPEEDWRCNNFAEVVEQVEAELGIDINLNLIQDNVDWGDYKNEFVLSSEAGTPVDIVLSGHEDIGAWAAAGLIMPLSQEMIDQHEEFADLVPTLWETVSWNGQIYGIPQDAEARPIFYSKLLLRDLGWSDEEIESLPERVASGEFTFADMMDVAQQAVEEGVVEEGHGYWHRTSNGPDFLYYYYGMGGEIENEDGVMVFDRAAALRVFELFNELTDRGLTRRDMIGLDGNTIVNPSIASAEKVLFNAGGTWNWANWALNYVADRGGNDYLAENIGLTLIPALDTGDPLTLTHPLVYMISSQSEHPDVALALIAAITTPEANNRHAIDSFHLGILQSQLESEDYLNNPQISNAHYMLDYATSLPNNPNWGTWSEAYYTGIQAVENGDLEPEDAIETVVQQLQNELGDNVIIR